MEEVLHDMIVALRSSGVRISVSESMDAMHAARLMGYANRQVLKDSLSSALAKSQREKEIFDTCFDQFFSVDQFSDIQPDSPALLKMEPDQKDAPLTQMLLAGDYAGLSLSMRDAAQNTDVKGIRFFTQKSLYIQQILKGMGGEGLDRDIRRISYEKDSSSRQKAEALKAAKDFLFENVRDFVEQQFSLFAPLATEAILEKYLRGVRLSNLEQRDFHRLKAIVQKMVKRLNNLHSRRRKTSKRGCLDFKKTLRENIACQGVLFNPRWKARRIDRPDIVAICDISRSVEMVSRFMLLFLYSLSEAVARIRSFVFCSNLVEVSHVFEEYPVDAALERLQKGIGLDIVLGRTDYGQAFRDFKGNWLDRVTKKTTVLVLGDGRNNYGNPQTDILKLIRERSKTLIWLNPEPPSFWGTGDSEMKRYQPYCYLVRECSTVNHLERLVDLLLTTGR
jgi:uncharacterized protein with von Willebrand factor type A (vWA) domain